MVKMSMHLIPPLQEEGAWPASAPCPIEETMRVVGARPAMILLREAAYGVSRFDEFVTRTGLSGATVSARLGELAAAGLMERRPYQEPGARGREEYVLTPSGLDLLPVIVGLFDWGVRHGNTRMPLTLTHTGCGQAVHAEVRCDAGHNATLDELTLTQSRPNQSSTGA